MEALYWSIQYDQTFIDSVVTGLGFGLMYIPSVVVR